MKPFYSEASDQHILIQIDNTSAKSAINKMGSMVSIEIDIKQWHSQKEKKEKNL